MLLRVSLYTSLSHVSVRSCHPKLRGEAGWHCGTNLEMNSTPCVPEKLSCCHGTPSAGADERRRVVWLVGGFIFVISSNS